MCDIGNQQTKLVSMIELSSSFLEAILTKNFQNDAEIWQEYSMLKVKIYSNMEALSDCCGSNASTNPDLDKHTSPQASTNSQSGTNTGKNSAFDVSSRYVSLNTLLFADSASDPLSFDDSSLKVFQSNEKVTKSTKISEFIPTIDALLIKINYMDPQLLINTGILKNFNGARSIVPSKSAFYRLISSAYIENLLLSETPMNRMILRNLFNLVYERKLLLKGPGSKNPTDTLRSTFCGYLQEIYRISLRDPKQAAATLHDMINLDPAFDQSLVSFCKEAIIFCLNDSGFVGENFSCLDKNEIPQIIERVFGSDEMTDSLIELISTIFQVKMSVIFTSEREFRQKDFNFSSTKTDKDFLLQIISNTYKGYLTYIVVYSKQESPKNTPPQSYLGDSAKKIEANEEKSFNRGNTSKNHENYHESYVKPQVIRDSNEELRNSPRNSNLSSGNNSMKHFLEKRDSLLDLPPRRPLVFQNHTKTHSGYNTPNSYTNNSFSSEYSPARKDRSSLSRENDYFSPKGRQDSPTKSFEYKSEELKYASSYQLQNHNKITGFQYSSSPFKRYQAIHTSGESPIIQQISNTTAIERENYSVNTKTDQINSNSSVNPEIIAFEKTVFLVQNKEIFTQLDQTIQKMDFMIPNNTASLDNCLKNVVVADAITNSPSFKRTSQTYTRQFKKTVDDYESRFSTPKSLYSQKSEKTISTPPKGYAMKEALNNCPLANSNPTYQAPERYSSKYQNIPSQKY